MRPGPRNNTPYLLVFNNNNDYFTHIFRLPYSSRRPTVISRVTIIADRSRPLSVRPDIRR